MLKHLTIRNYALIKHLEMEPSANLNVITGETGAGKSIMLGAIGLLMGNRADTKVLWDENEKCVTEGTFELKNELTKQNVKDAISSAEQRLVEKGRLLVRASGTESVIRVMAEGDDAALVENIVGDLCAVIEKAARSA